MSKLLYPFYWFLKKSRVFSALACRLTKLTGKSRYPVHPKHLINIENPWFYSGLKKTDQVVDLGCGNGLQSLKMAEKVEKVVAIDNNFDQLRIGKNQALEKRIKNVSFIKADLEKKLLYKSDFFDKAFCLDVLEHLTKREFFLRQVKRILKKAGKLYLSVPNKETSWKKKQRKIGLNSFTDPDHKIEYSEAEIRNLLTKLGFKIVSLKPVVLDTPFQGLIDLIGGFSLSLYQRLTIWKKRRVVNNLRESTGFRIICKLDSG